MGRRAAIIISIVTASVLSLALTGFFTWQVQDRRAQVVAADEAAEEYTQDESSFRGELSSLISARPDQVSKDVAKVLKSQPKLAEVGDYGEENSEEYQDAVELEEESEKSLKGLQEAADDYESSMKYGAVARQALVDPKRYIRNRFDTSGREIRSKALPPVQRARNRFAKVDPPEGGEQVKREVLAALDFTIRDVRRVAKAVDRDRVGTFTFMFRQSSAQSRIWSYESQARSAYTQAIGEATDPPSASY